MSHLLPRNIHTKEDLYNYLDKISHNPTFSDAIKYELMQKNKHETEAVIDAKINDTILSVLKVRYPDFTKDQMTRMSNTFKNIKFNRNIIYMVQPPMDWAKIIDNYRKHDLPSWYIKHLELLQQVKIGFSEPTKKKQSPLPQPPSLPSNEVPKFVAQGSFGCVHRPSLFCNPPNHPDYRGKVSKVMTTKNMNKELKEYVLIARADPKHDFYLGKPETCPLGIAPINVPPLEKCSIGKDIIKNPQDYSLILMKDGGQNWDEFADMMKNLPVNRENISRMEMFWVEARRMIYGVKAFQDAGIMHHDLKAQNIVYDEPTKRSNFIDFGLMEDMKETEKRCNHNEYRYAVFHWSYPFETMLLNHNQFKQMATSSIKVRNKFIKDFVGVYQNAKDNRGSWVRLFFREAGIDDNGIRNNFLRMYQDFIMNKLPKLQYKHFIDLYFAKMDIYGLGLSLMYVLSRTHKFMPEFAKRASPLFLFMLYPDPTTRCSIDRLIQEYDRIMIDMGLAKKYKIPGLHKESPQVLIDSPENAEKIWNSVNSKNDTNEKVASVLVELDPIPSIAKNPSTTLENMHISTPSTISIASNTRRRKRSKSAKSKSTKRMKVSTTIPMDVVDSKTIYPEKSIGVPMDVYYASSHGRPKGVQAKMDVDEEYKKSTTVPMDVVDSIKIQKTRKTRKTYKMCSPGQKRNPVTNRCQKNKKPWSV